MVTGVECLNGAQKGVERGSILESAETGCIGRGDIKHKIVTKMLEVTERCGVVGGSLLERGDFTFTEVDSDGNGWPVTGGAEILEATGNLFCTLIVESEAVNQSVNLGDSEDSRLWVTWLCLGGDGADLCKPKPEGFPPRESQCIFIESGCKSDG